MKKIGLVGLFILAPSLIILSDTALAQPYGMGPGMMGGYGYGYGMGPGMMGAWGYIDIPAKLPPPKETEWVRKLKEILVLEIQSLQQYQADQEKFNAHMPYTMIIPQENNHVHWIDQLFTAYGMYPPEEKAPSPVENKTLDEAYGNAAKMESGLVPRYEWLVKKAEDNESARILNNILLQTRWHLVMFEHATRMGHGHGYGRGAGMMGGYGPGYGMGPGMMWGGYGQGSVPGNRNQTLNQAITIEEAQSILKNYLGSSRNPNLKLGKIKDAGNDYEAEIMTKHNDLVDKVLIDKRSGWIRSVY